jgi:hypothetical protein
MEIDQTDDVKHVRKHTYDLVDFHHDILNLANWTHDGKSAVKLEVVPCWGF